MGNWKIENVATLQGGREGDYSLRCNYAPVEIECHHRKNNNEKEQTTSKLSSTQVLICS